MCGEKKESAFLSSRRYIPSELLNSLRPIEDFATLERNPAAQAALTFESRGFFVGTGCVAMLPEPPGKN